MRIRKLAILAACVCAGSAKAQSGGPLILLPFEKDTNVELRGQATVLASGENSNNSGQDFDLSIYDTSGRFSTGVGESLGKSFDGSSFRMGYDLTYMSTDLENSDFPDQLTDQSVSFGMVGIKVGEWQMGWQAGLGYAGDSPFSDGDAYYGLGTVSFTRVYNTEPGRFEALTLLVDYDGNRTIFPDVPLPGFVYTREFGEQFTMNLGFPFLSLEYKPVEKLTLKILYAIPDYFELRADYALTERVGFFAALDSRSEAFHSNTLDNNLDRIMYQQRRAEAGVGLEVCKGAKIELAGGYAFGQEFTQGFDRRDDDEIFEPTDELYVRAGLEVKW
jgi:hypothetical protein